MCDRCGGVSDEQYARQIERNIQTYGWTMQYIEGDGGRNPAFGYTLGLSLYGHPEFIVFEAEPSYAYLGLKPLAWAVMEGAVFDEGDDLSGFFPPPHTAELLRFPDSAHHLFTANAMFRQPGDPPIAALQLIWPTRTALIQPSGCRPAPDRGAR